MGMCLLHKHESRHCVPSTCREPSIRITYALPALKADTGPCMGLLADQKSIRELQLQSENLSGKIKTPGKQRKMPLAFMCMCGHTQIIKIYPGDMRKTFFNSMFLNVSYGTLRASMGELQRASGKASSIQSHILMSRCLLPAGPV